MPIIVVGGSSKNVGKTALVCGLIAALPEFAWTAVKITSHEHGKAESIWEETAAGTETDTARYLAAGARRAFLISTDDADLPFRLGELQAKLEAGAHLIFESNRILQHVQPDIFLAVEGGPQSEEKLSFREVAHPMTARVVRARFCVCRSNSAVSTGRAGSHLRGDAALDQGAAGGSQGRHTARHSSALPVVLSAGFSINAHKKDFGRNLWIDVIF